MSRQVAHHLHESPPVMTLPLGVLALLTLVAGLAVGAPAAEGTRFARFLAAEFPLPAREASGALTLVLAVISLAVAVAGITLAWVVYLSAPVQAEAIGRPRTWIHRFLLEAWYFDRLYDRAVVRPLLALSLFLARAVDLGVIDGAVNAIGRATAAGAARARRVQTGYVVNYALTMLVGAVAVVGFLLARR
jgi:NADH-quinone oxidoreductase subunit L